MKNSNFKLYGLLIAFTALSYLSSCKRDVVVQEAPLSLSIKKTEVLPPPYTGAGEIHLADTVRFYPNNGVSYTNANTATILSNVYDNLVYATKLTDLQKQSIGAKLTLKLNVYPGTADTEPFGYFYYFKTANNTAVPTTKDDAGLTAAYNTRRVEMARYILPYLATDWTSGVLKTISPSTAVTYAFDLSAFASALKDPDSTVWIAHNQGQPGNQSFTYKVDAFLANSGSTVVSTFSRDYVQPIFPYARFDAPKSTTITRTFTVPNDLTNAQIRTLYTGSEGQYTQNVVSIDGVQIDSYSTRMICQPESRYQDRNPSVANGGTQSGLWNYPTRNYCQSDTVPPHLSNIPGTLTKGTHTLTMTIAQNAGSTANMMLSINLIGKKGSGTTPPPVGVQFFQDSNYGGAASQLLTKGNYTLAQLVAKGVPNDWASSVKIPAGWSITMYADDNFSGTSWNLTASNTWFGALSPNANDKMSSVKIQ